MAKPAGQPRVRRVQCKYPQCGREEKRDQHCIFHLQDKTKEEAVEFYRELAQHKKRSEEAPSVPGVDFGGFFFPEPICDFKNEHFKKEAWFRNATFDGEALFYGATFSRGASFHEATFIGDASFQNVTFTGMASFHAATFTGKAWFDSAKFSEIALFDSARFSEIALFGGATFPGIASFQDATFGRDAWFSGATFKNAFFKRTLFLGTAALEARFDRIAVFERVVFQRDTIESSDLTMATQNSTRLPVASFDGAYVSEGAEVRFIQQREYRADLDVERNFGIDRVSFLNVDLERFNFQEVEWGRLHGRRAVIEEALMGRPPFEHVTPEQVRQIYARLRANQEKAFRYAEAGDFFIGEMDMRRRWLRDRGSGAFPERFLLWLFSGLSKYGESLTRPALATVIVIMGLAGLRLVLGEPSEWRFCQPLSVEESLIRSVASFFQLRSTTIWTDILERLVSIPILGVLFIALRRKLERRS